MIEHIPALTIEPNDDGTITLEQDWSGNVDRVTVHPVHLRFMAERLGLVREVSASDADMVRTVTTVKRRLRLLQDRVKHLHEMLVIVAGTGREELDYELTHCGATLDLLEEFLEDLAEPVTQSPTASRHVTPSHAAVTRDAPGTTTAGTQTKPTGNPAETQRVPVGSAQLTLEAA